MKNIIRNTWLLLLPWFLVNCEKDQNQTMDNEEELITDVVLTFTDELGAEQVFTFSDPDGPGGNSPSQDEVRLSSLQNYELSIQFLDASDPMDVEDITEEVMEEAAEHLVCYEFTGNINAITITDSDENNLPLGLEALITTGQSGNGSLTISLKHLPDKTNTLPCSTGETDVEVTFQMVIQ
jgi:hypothetical protein